MSTGHGGIDRNDTLPVTLTSPVENRPSVLDTASLSCDDKFTRVYEPSSSTLFQDVNTDERGAQGEVDSGNTPTVALGVDVGCTDRSISFLHWNVCGLLSKLNDNNFVQYLSSFDFVCIVETFLDHFDTCLFPNYDIFCKSAVKLTKQGRQSGGVVCLIRSNLTRFVRELKSDCHNVLFFLLDKSLFGFSKDVVYVCAYIPPECSPYYAHYDIDNGIDLLEEALSDILLSLDDVYVILCGDLNARTSNMIPDTSCVTNNYENSLFRENNESVCRCSEDQILNTYGKYVLNLCITLGLSIMNGVCNGDHQGCYTYISETGNSVNDYFLISDELFARVQFCCWLCVSERIDSDHLPLEFHIERKEEILSTKDCNMNTFIEKFEWKDEFAQSFITAMRSEETKDKLDYAASFIDRDVNVALKLFNEYLKEQAYCMNKRIFINKYKQTDRWFDKECECTKRNVRRLLRKFRRTLKPVDRVTYCKAKREYKSLLHKKKKDFNDTIIDKLVKSVKDQKCFWETLHSISKRKPQPSNNITIEEWFDHFKNVLEKEIDEEEEADLDSDNGDDVLDRPISREEVLLAIRKLKNNKAAGPDGIIGEMLKYAGDPVVDFLVKLFNILFDRGIFPDSWSESILLPLFKKGAPNDPNNYRGISLCNISGKLYSTVINNRLQEWIEQNDTTGEYQAGFKKNYSTTDHIFTLFATIQKQFSLNRKLYVAFIDFEKAFDSISRKLLWPILIKNGIKGKLHRSILSMYTNVRARVRCGAQLSDYICCTRGVKQGDVCSPVLFSLFINELALEVINNGRHGVSYSSYFIELFILLFADDIALISETVIGLQTQLNSLRQSALKLNLTVNMNKSNIMVFRKGGYLAAREKWFYGDLEMKIVNSYKYLGVVFTTKLSLTYTCQELISRGKNAVLSIMKKLYKLEHCSLEIFFKLFDAQVQPIVQYGAEIWGIEASAPAIEKLHLFAMKKFLCVDKRTPNDLVYGELGRYPIYINSNLRCVRYWIKLIQMNENRLPFKAYKMLYDLDEKGKRNWVSKLREFLCSNGFSYVWMNQGVGCTASFLQMLKQRLVDCRWQCLDDHVQTSERFDFYRKFKTFYEAEPYLFLDLNRYIKGALTRFRFGISDLSVHSLRYRSYDVRQLTCPMCKEAMENEIHFVLCCPVLDDIRRQYIPRKYYNFPSDFRLTLLLSTRHEQTLRNLALFLYKSFHRRKIIMS